MFKYLKAIYREVGELKKAFRDLLMVLHPDKGGSNEECAILIGEYEVLIKRIPKKVAFEREQHKPESQRVYKASDFCSYDEDFILAMMSLIGLKMADVTIEVCGWFIYVGGTGTKERKDEIKKIGLKWNSTKNLWYFAPAWWSAGKNHKPWEMDSIRMAYGSKKVEDEGAKQVTA